MNKERVLGCSQSWKSMTRLCIHNYFINKCLLESHICLFPQSARLSLMYHRLNEARRSAGLAFFSFPPSLSTDRFLWFRKSCKPHTSPQDWWLVNNISQHYGPHQCRTESIRPSKKSNKLTWPSSAGLTLQEMSFFKESASALLIHPTLRCLDEDLLLQLFAGSAG